MAPVDPTELLAQIDHSDAREAAVLARALLLDPSVHLLAHTRPGRVDHWARVYRLKQISAERGGTKTWGFADLFARFEILPSNQLLSLASFEIDQQMGLFWLDERHFMVSFVILDPRHKSER